jgi:hypothetical protein
MTKVIKTYTGTFYEQLAAYRADRCEVDVLFRRDCEGVNHPRPPQQGQLKHVSTNR